MSSFKDRVLAEARPGETWLETSARLAGTRNQDVARPGESWQEFTDRLGGANGNVKEEDRLSDFLVSRGIIATKDSRHFMDVAIFRMSKQKKRIGEVVRYDLADGYVEVKAGPDGMATIWDYDIVLMLISNLTESMNLYRKGRGAMPGRLFNPYVSDILQFCRRGDGGDQSTRVESALDRLKGTTIKRVSSRVERNGERVMREVKSESLISGYRVLSHSISGKVERVEIEVPSWIYTQVTGSLKSTVLTLSSEYFLIDSAIARFIYRLARCAAGTTVARWGFKTIYDRSGVTCFKEFCRILRRLVRSNNLPEYELSEEAGRYGPQLIMARRR